MNYLAHALLSPADAVLLTGNIITDMAKGSERRRIPALFLPGMQLHSLIDNYTDTHEGLRMIRQEIAPVTGRYTPVLLDIFMDFYLAHNWLSYSALPRAAFEADIYARLNSQIPLLPANLAARLQHMVAHRWLGVYWSAAQLDEVIRRLSARARTPELLLNVQSGYDLAYPLLDHLFPGFFAELSAEIKRNY